MQDRSAQWSLLLLVCACAMFLTLAAGTYSSLTAQPVTDSPTGLGPPGEGLQAQRARRDSLRRQLRDLQNKERTLTRERHNLLSLQAQLQEKIGQTQRELKLPLMPKEYYKTKCKLKDLNDQNQNVLQKIKKNEEQLNRTREQMSQVELQLMTIRRRISRARTESRPPALQPYQETRRRRLDPLDIRMTRPVNPLGDLPVSIAEQTTQITGGGAAGLPSTTNNTIGGVLTTPTYSEAQFAPAILRSSFTSGGHFTLSLNGSVTKSAGPSVNLYVELIVDGSPVNVGYIAVPAAMATYSMGPLFVQTMNVQDSSIAGSSGVVSSVRISVAGTGFPVDGWIATLTYNLP